MDREGFRVCVVCAMNPFFLLSSLSSFSYGADLLPSNSSRNTKHGVFCLLIGAIIHIARSESQKGETGSLFFEMEKLMNVLCLKAGKETKFYQSTKASLAHKILIPLVLLVSAGAAAPFFLLPYDQLSYTCTNPYNASMSLYKGETQPESEKFAIDLYSMVVTVFTYVLPILILPLAVPIAILRTCLARQCCVNRYKQPIGELVMVTLIDMIYLGTVVGVVLPQIDNMLQSTELVNLGSVPLLWELGNDAARPLVYFMTNPAVWDGLQAMCCHSKHQLVNNDDAEETEVPLSPVTTV